jgi:hypothetical protein
MLVLALVVTACGPERRGARDLNDDSPSDVTSSPADASAAEPDAGPAAVDAGGAIDAGACGANGATCCFDQATGYSCNGTAKCQGNPLRCASCGFAGQPCCGGTGGTCEVGVCFHSTCEVCVDDPSCTGCGASGDECCRVTGEWRCDGSLTTTGPMPDGTACRCL